MATNRTRPPLQYYLGLQYPFDAIADPDGGYVVIFPDLPGCMTQVETLGELPEMTEDARVGWIETEYERGNEIPLPSMQVEYSGKFNVRIPRTLHRSLAHAAGREGMSLNQYVLMLLSRGDAQTQLERNLNQILVQLGALNKRLPYRVGQIPPVPERGRTKQELV